MIMYLFSCATKYTSYKSANSDQRAWTEKMLVEIDIGTRQYCCKEPAEAYHWHVLM